MTAQAAAERMMALFQDGQIPANAKTDTLNRMLNSGEHSFVKGSRLVDLQGIGSIRREENGSLLVEGTDKDGKTIRVRMWPNEFAEPGDLGSALLFNYEHWEPDGRLSVFTLMTTMGAAAEDFARLEAARSFAPTAPQTGL